MESFYLNRNNPRHPQPLKVMMDVVDHDHVVRAMRLQLTMRLSVTDTCSGALHSMPDDQLHPHLHLHPHPLLLLLRLRTRRAMLWGLVVTRAILRAGAVKTAAA